MDQNSDKLKSEQVHSWEGRPVLIITTEHWTKTWFTKLLVSACRFPTIKVTFVDIASVSTYQAKFNLLRDAISQCVKNEKTTPLVFACTDVAMDVYSAVIEHIKLNESNALEKTMTGAHFLSFFLATNKLACRKLVKGCDGVRTQGVLNNMATLPLLGKDVTGFFKPLAECGSEGVFKCESNDAGIANPLSDSTNPMGNNDIVSALAIRYDELKPYLDKNLVGLVEEYISPVGRRVVSVDGFVFQGKLHRYTMSENIYCENQPEVFDSLVTPAQGLGKELKTKIWALWEKVIGDLVARGLNNQFADVECFVLPDGRVEVMEVNCRTYSNQLPIFSRVFSGSRTCMFSAALDLMKGQPPPFIGQLPDAKNKVGVCAYMDVIPGAPDWYESEYEEDGCYASYYHVTGPGARKYPAHIYVVSTKGAEVARERCNTFHAEVTRKFATVTKSTRKFPRALLTAVFLGVVLCFSQKK